MYKQVTRHPARTLGRIMRYSFRLWGLYQWQSPGNATRSCLCFWAQSDAGLGEFYIRPASSSCVISSWTDRPSLSLQTRVILVKTSIHAWDCEEEFHAAFIIKRVFSLHLCLLHSQLHPRPDGGSRDEKVDMNGFMVNVINPTENKLVSYR